jgi:2,4-dienoyl-CoA reductase (NADPH2)
MARPFLADPEFVLKASTGREDEINTCIGCNQACLDLIFQGQQASCLVNPRACKETELVYHPTQKSRKIAVVGAGPAGLSFATVAAQRGHKVTLFELSSEIGGQFNLAKKVPGKEEFHETLRYFKRQLELSGVELKLNQKATAKDLCSQSFDHVVLATGIRPRTPQIEGIQHKKVVSYIDVLLGKVEIGKSVAIIGAGGIGFDVAEFLSEQPNHSLSLDKDAFLKHWGVDLPFNAAGKELGKGPGNAPGGLSRSGRVIAPSHRKITLLQRSQGKLGHRLGKTTGWIHRTSLKDKGITFLDAIAYQKIDDQGLHILKKNTHQTLQVDHIVICAGQDPLQDLKIELDLLGFQNHLIGGAKIATELDAHRAIREGAQLASSIESFNPHAR